MIRKILQHTGIRAHAGLCALGLVMLLPFARGAAQSEHVPSTHPVYEFLDRMEVRGELPDYSRAVLPLTRGEVTAFVRSLDSLAQTTEHRILYSETERALLARYRDEFVAEADGTQRPAVLFAGGETFAGKVDGALSDREKFLYVWANPGRATTFHAEFLGSLETRVQPGGSGLPTVTLGQVGGRFRGQIGGSFGYGLQATNGTAFGSRAAALNDRVVRQNANFSDFGNRYFDITEAYVSAAWEWGDASLGKETILWGNGPAGRVIIGTTAPPFDAIRLNVHSGDVRFSFLHGFLLSQPEESADRIRPMYPAKYIAAHRLEADLFSALRFGVFETVIYGHREADFAYLNPVNFYKSAEHANGDRDNPLLGFDLATLFWRGSQFYGSWTIDDVDFARLGSHWWGNKFAWVGGWVSHALLPDGEVGVEYTHIEPYTFTHTIPDNEYTNKGYALGLDMQPNSDEWTLRARRWIGASLVLGVTVQYRRHGMNEMRDTVLVKNNGGDINQRFVWGRDAEVEPFLTGPLETQAVLTASLRWEPVRNIVLDAAYRYRRFGGVRTADHDHFVSLLLDIRY